MRLWWIGIGVMVGVGPIGVAQPAALDAATTAQATDPQHFDLLAEHELAQGDSYRWSSNEYERTTLTWGEGDDAQVESDTYLKYGILANSQVNQVDEESNALVVTHIIERLYLMEDELLVPGTVVVATREEDETVYTIGDDRIENETLLYVLDHVADLDTDRPDNLQQMFRVPDTPQPIGARWEIDGPAFFGSILGEGVELGVAEASGELHLAQTQDVFGSPGLRIEMQLMLDGALEAYAATHPQWELLANTLIIEGVMLTPQSPEHMENSHEINSRLTQQWRDPEEARVGTLVVYHEVSAGERELTPRERELLGFE